MTLDRTGVLTRLHAADRTRDHESATEQRELFGGERDLLSGDYVQASWCGALRRRSASSSAISMVLRLSRG